MVNSEKNLQKVFLSVLAGENSPWNVAKYYEEFNFNGGRTDVIAIDDFSVLYAFELKLEKWKVALIQAYRNTSFANKSYVVLPKESAIKAARYEYQFKRRAVGLCYIEDNTIVEIYDCKKNNKLLMPWLNNKARNSLKE